MSGSKRPTKAKRPKLNRCTCHCSNCCPQTLVQQTEPTETIEYFEYLVESVSDDDADAEPADDQVGMLCEMASALDADTSNDSLVGMYDYADYCGHYAPMMSPPQQQHRHCHCHHWDGPLTHQPPCQCNTANFGNSNLNPLQTTGDAASSTYVVVEPSSDTEADVATTSQQNEITNKNNLRIEELPD